MQIVGLTGNIGSGKSTIAKAFNALGIPVFNSDAEAKKAYSFPSIQSEVQAILEKSIDFNQNNWKDEIASVIFSDRSKREKLETLIHEEVRKAFTKWCELQHSKYVIREAALANSFQPENCDWLIEVTADKETRMKRVMIRNNFSESEFNRRDALQKTNENFPTSKTLRITNNDEDQVLSQVLRIHERLSL